MKYFALMLFGVLILGGIWFLDRESVQPVMTPEISTDETLPTARINGFELQLDIVRTPEEKARGLSDRESLAENMGMLFVYEKPVLPGFWMKDMKFPIDIIWIDAGKKIVDITENLVPETFSQLFYPRSPVLYVLEVNANWARNHNVTIGDEAIFHGIF